MPKRPVFQAEEINFSSAVSQLLLSFEPAARKFDALILETGVDRYLGEIELERIISDAVQESLGFHLSARMICSKTRQAHDYGGISIMAMIIWVVCHCNAGLSQDANRRFAKQPISCNGRFCPNAP